MARRLNADASTILLVRLDEPDGGNPTDLGPNGLTITNAGTTAVAVTGMPFVVARDFDRSDTQDIAVTDTALIQPVTMSVEAVVNITDLGAVNQGIFYRYSGTAFNGWLMGINSQTIFFGVKSVSEEYRVATFDYTAYFGAWHYICGTYNGEVVRFFLDGTQVATSSVAAYSAIKYTDVTNGYIGSFRDYGPDTRYFDGQIAEVRLSNKVRTPWEIYNTYAAVTDPQAGFTVEGTGSVAVYNFNNPSEGAIVYDDTGNHNGTVSGSVPLATGSVSSVARTFNNSDSNYLVVPHHADFKIDTDWTMEFYVSVLTLGDSAHIILSKGQLGANPYLLFGYNEGAQNLFGSVRTSDDHQIAIAVPSVAETNRLNYYAFTFDYSAKKMILYKDGTKILDSVEVGTYVGGDNSDNLYIGRLNGYTAPHNGPIHAIRWSNYVKTPKEIFDYYNGSNIKYRLT